MSSDQRLKFQTPKRPFSNSRRGTGTAVKGCKLQASFLSKICTFDSFLECVKCVRKSLPESGAQLGREGAIALIHYV